MVKLPRWPITSCLELLLVAMTNTTSLSLCSGRCSRHHLGLVLVLIGHFGRLLRTSMRLTTSIVKPFMSEEFRVFKSPFIILILFTFRCRRVSSISVNMTDILGLRAEGRVSFRFVSTHVVHQLGRVRI